MMFLVYSCFFLLFLVVSCRFLFFLCFLAYSGVFLCLLVFLVFRVSLFFVSSWLSLVLLGSSCFLLFRLVSSLFVSLFVFVCVCFNYVFVLQLVAGDIEHHPCGNSAKMHWRHWHWKRRGISKRSGHRPCEINMGIVQQSMHLAVMRSHKHKENNGESWRIKKSFLALRQAHEFCGTVLVGR